MTKMYLGESEKDSVEPLVSKDAESLDKSQGLGYEGILRDDNGIHGNRRRSATSSFASTVPPANSAYLSMFLLLNTMIGSGILNQPYVFMKSGMVGALLAFFLTTIATWCGLILLTEAGLYANTLEFSGLAKAAFGEKGETLVDVSIIMMTVGAELGYIIVVGETLSSLLEEWGCTMEVCEQFWVTIIAVVFFVTPICLFRHFGHLAMLSIFSVLAIVLCLLLVVIGGPIENRNEVGNDITFINWLGMLSSVGSIVFSLSCASANFQAYISTEEKSQNIRTWSWVTAGAVLTGAIMCISMGMIGYLVFGNETNGEILNNFPEMRFDFFKVMVVAHLILYIPVNFIIMRYSFVKMTLGLKSEDLPMFLHTGLSLAMIAVLTGAVLLLDNFGIANGLGFSIILNITGGIAGSLAAFILPSMIYLKIMPKDSALYGIAKGVLTMGCSVAVVVVISTIIEVLPR